MIIPNHNYTARERTVCEILAPLTNVRRMLNVGIGHAGDPRRVWWIDICRANGAENHVLEVTEVSRGRGERRKEKGESVESAELGTRSAERAAGIEYVTYRAVRDVARLYDEPFDAVLWWHGPETLEKAEAAAVIEELWQLTRGTLIVGCPVGGERQGIRQAESAELGTRSAERKDNDGNAHERQRSVWQTQDLFLMGFQTTVVRDVQPCPHITAWRNRVETVTYYPDKGTFETSRPVKDIELMPTHTTTWYDLPAENDSNDPEG